MAFNKLKRCAGTFDCRFHFVLKLAIFLTLAGIIGVFVFVR